MSDNVKSLRQVALLTVAGEPIPYHALMTDDNEVVSVLRNGSYLHHDDLEATISCALLDVGAMATVMSFTSFGPNYESSLLMLDIPSRVADSLAHLKVTYGLWAVNHIFERFSLMLGVYIRGLKENDNPAFVAVPLPVVHGSSDDSAAEITDYIVDNLFPTWSEKVVPIVSAGFWVEDDPQIVANFVQQLYESKSDIPHKMVTNAYSFYARAEATTLLEFLAYLSLAIESHGLTESRRFLLRQRVCSEIKKREKIKKEEGNE
jgi:hypothetical protein